MNSVNDFNSAKAYLKSKKHKWLVTGCAGFIGSNLLEFLLEHNQEVVGLDNFSTGKQENLEDVKNKCGENWESFTFFEGDISTLEECQSAIKGVDYVLHQAALGSVPRSINDPINSNNSNVTGFLNLAWLAVQENVKKFVYASSSSVYGDDPNLPKQESVVGNPLSPYAVTKKVNELYSEVFHKAYNFPVIGIRYFNVFGKRQDPNGVYSAVIPRWVSGMIKNEEIKIFGDGETSRDFCYISNVVQMNILAALSSNENANGQVFNCAYSDRTTLNELFDAIKEGLSKSYDHVSNIEAKYEDFRKGDIRHSHANIKKAQELLGYKPTHSIRDGLKEALSWYVDYV